MDAAWHDRAPPLSAPTPTPKCTLSQTPRGHPSREVGNLCIIPRWVPNTYTQAHSQVPQNEMHTGTHTLVKSPQAPTHSLTITRTIVDTPQSQACVHTHTRYTDNMLHSGSGFGYCYFWLFISPHSAVNLPSPTPPGGHPCKPPLADDPGSSQGFLFMAVGH